jgi:hypothetical protein
MTEEKEEQKLKPSPDIIQDPLCCYRYKYTSADHRYYILATFASSLDGINRAKWPKYSFYDNNYHEEGNITLSKDFQTTAYRVGAEYEENRLDSQFRVYQRMH